MIATTLDPVDYISAVFGPDFVDGHSSLDAVEHIHCGDVGDWVDALGRSGLFSNRVVADAERAWKADPRLLLEALLADADQMTAKRFDIIWESLERTAFAEYA